MKVHVRMARLTRVRQLRQERGVTQVTLGKALGLGATHVSHIEHGRRPVNLEQALRIAETLGCELKELVSWRKP